MNRKISTELIGWYGMIAILAAYTLLSFQIVSSTNLLYQLLNGTGALGIVYISIRKQAYQPAVLNIVWALIAIVAIVRMLLP